MLSPTITEVLINENGSSPGLIALYIVGITALLTVLTIGVKQIILLVKKLLNKTHD